MSAKFSFAVIGTGMAAKPHALALKSLSDQIDVKGVYSRDRKKRELFAAEHGFVATQDPQALAQDKDVDALLLITPPNARADLIEMFAGAGKHILCEKPLERTLDAAQQIAACCAKRKVQLGIVFQHRFREASQQLASMLASGTLGNIRAVRVEVAWWRDQAYYDEPGRGTLERDGGGVLISQAIHTLDLMLSLAGPVASVQALAATTALHKMECEDFVAAGIEFENGAAGSLVATTSAYPGSAESISMDLDNASIVLKAGVLTVSWRDGKTESFGEKATTGGGSDPMAFPFAWHRDLIASFASQVVSGNKPLVSGQDAVAVQALIEAVLLSAKQGKRIVLSGISSA